MIASVPLNERPITERPMVIRSRQPVAPYDRPTFRKPWVAAWRTPRGDVVTARHRTHAGAMARADRAALGDTANPARPVILGSRIDYALAGPKGARQ